MLQAVREQRPALLAGIVMASTMFLTIAYTTALLKSLIEHGLVRNRIVDLVGGVAVSTLLPEQASPGVDEQARLNLFLCYVAPNTRVRSLESRARSEQLSAGAPLALDLHYTISAFSAKELHAELLLGYVSEFFSDRPGLSFQAGSWCVQGSPTIKEKEAIGSPSVPGVTADLPMQIGSIAIRPLFPNPDELSKLWSALQVKYRPSLNYKVEIQPDRIGRLATPVGAH